MSDYNLERFITAHNRDYDTAYNELKQGKKLSHWMWFIFPQIKGLGKSPTSEFYGIQNLDEAKAYINHPILGNNMIKICQVLFSLESNNPTEIFGRPDDMKLKSSMTLFSLAADDNRIFVRVLDKFYNGKLDNRTIRIVEKNM